MNEYIGPSYSNPDNNILLYDNIILLSLNRNKYALYLLAIFKISNLFQVTELLHPPDTLLTMSILLPT